MSFSFTLYPPSITELVSKHSCWGAECLPALTWWTKQCQTLGHEWCNHATDPSNVKEETFLTRDMWYLISDTVLLNIPQHKPRTDPPSKTIYDQQTNNSCLNNFKGYFFITRTISVPVKTAQGLLLWESLCSFWALNSIAMWWKGKSTRSSSLSISGDNGLLRKSVFGQQVQWMSDKPGAFHNSPLYME